MKTLTYFGFGFFGVKIAVPIPVGVGRHQKNGVFPHLKSKDGKSQKTVLILTTRKSCRPPRLQASPPATRVGGNFWLWARWQRRKKKRIKDVGTLPSHWARSPTWRHVGVGEHFLPRWTDDWQHVDRWNVQLLKGEVKHSYFFSFFALFFFICCFFLLF